MELLGELVAAIVAGRAKFPSEEQCSAAGVDGDAAALNYLVARRIHAVCSRVDPKME